MLVKIDNCLTFHKEDRYEIYIGKVKKRLGFHNTKEDEFPPCPLPAYFAVTCGS